jgi:hypothetical protein
MMKYFGALIVFLVLLLGCCGMPVAGVTTYLGGSPHMSAALAGTNEFTSGQDAIIWVTVQNSGVESLQFELKGSIAEDDLPTTAKGVTVGLSSGGAPVIVKSDPQVVGDIKSQGLATVAITTKITSDATAGEYQLPLTVGYTYLVSSEQAGTDNIQFNYQQMTETFPITIKIKPQVKIEVLEAVPENLNVGSEGFLNLKIKNTGLEDGKKASVKIIRSGASPLIPTDNSVFIGDFPRDGTVTCRYRISVSSDAEKQTYPVDVVVTYENRDGDLVNSAAETIGVPLGGKITFTSEPVQVVRGSQGVIQVTYMNSGTATAFKAQARLSAVKPFTSNDDTAYLGDLKPGETGVARYQFSVDDNAAAKEYNLDTQVRYRDILDNSQVSDTFNVPVKVLEKPASNVVMQVLAAVGIIALVGCGAGYYLLVVRRKK